MLGAGRPLGCGQKLRFGAEYSFHWSLIAEGEKKDVKTTMSCFSLGRLASQYQQSYCHCRPVEATASRRQSLKFKNIAVRPFSGTSTGKNWRDIKKVRMMRKISKSKRCMTEEEIWNAGQQEGDKQARTLKVVCCGG